MTLTVAVCTRNRPEDLAACAESVLAERLVDTLLLSSDGTDRATDEVGFALEATDPRVRFQRGPRCGLAANRNACIAVVTTDYLLFLDDDARLAPGFVATALGVVGPKTVVTGWERRPDGRVVSAHNADFLGFQVVKSPGDRRSVVINATIFPVGFLRDRPFDEFYRYGYEELDISLAARQAGLRIVDVDHGNLHLKSALARQGNSRAETRSRLYFGVRRYREYEPSPIRLARFLLFGTANAVGYAAKHGRWRDGATVGADAVSSAYMAFRPRRRLVSAGVDPAETTDGATELEAGG